MITHPEHEISSILILVRESLSRGFGRRHLSSRTIEARYYLGDIEEVRVVVDILHGRYIVG